MITYFLASFVAVALAMWAWNASLTELFPAIPKITYWKMYGLWILSYMLVHGQDPSKR